MHLYLCTGASASLCNYTAKTLVGGVSVLLWSVSLCISINGDWNWADHVGAGANKYWTIVWLKLPQKEEKREECTYFQTSSLHLFSIWSMFGYNSIWKWWRRRSSWKCVGWSAWLPSGPITFFPFCVTATSEEVCIRLQCRLWWRILSTVDCMQKYKLAFIIHWS